MSKLPIISAKDFEKLLLKMGFEVSVKKGVMFFINILTVVTPLSHIMPEEIYLVL